jgi:hypothetical protein
MVQMWRRLEGWPHRKRHTSAFPRHGFVRALSLDSSPLSSEGAGNAGRSMRPQPRVVVENTRVSHHGHTGNTRQSPRNGLRFSS